jgi:hypothetical protein
MAGWAATWELNGLGPWGTAAWLVVGAVVTVGGALVVEKTWDKSDTKDQAPAIPQAIPKTAECQDCKRYTVRVQAQGTDCGGTTSSTIGMPAITQPMPVTVTQGLALSQGTQAMLGRSQLKRRVGVIAKAHKYITDGPTSGGRFGAKSFVVYGLRGGIRYDVDCFGDGPSFVS